MKVVPLGSSPSSWTNAFKALVRQRKYRLKIAKPREQIKVLMKILQRALRKDVTDHRQSVDWQNGDNFVRLICHRKIASVERGWPGKTFKRRLFIHI